MRLSLPLAAVLLLAPLTASARFVRVEHPDDDLDKCNPAVQEGIKKLKRDDKRLHFDCKDGFLYHLFAPKGSALLKDSADIFVKARTELFLPSKPKQLDLSPAGQKYKGALIAKRFAYRQQGVELKSIGKDYTMLWVSLSDTDGWDFEPAYVVSQSKAVELARAFEEKVSGKKDLDYHAQQFPLIEERICDGKAALVWRVFAGTHSDKVPGSTKNKDRQLRYLFVEAGKGKVCGRSSGTR